MTDIPKRGARHAGYRMLNRLLRHKVPQAMETYGMPDQAETLRQQAEIKDEEQAYMATQALAAITISYATALTRMLDTMPPELRPNVLAQMPNVQDVIDALEGVE